MSQTPSPPPTFWSRLRFNTTPTDVFLLAGATFWVLRLYWAPASAHRSHGLMVYGGAALLVTVAWISMRSGWLRRRRGGSLAFRLAVFSSLDLPFMFGLRSALMALQPELLDMELIALDRMIFGEVPAVALAPYVHPWVVEWLAFFYFNYFVLVTVVVLPAVVMGRDSIRMEALFGIMFIVVVGHILYTLVPGKGPYAAIQFAAPLDGGPFWALVLETVRLMGPQLDIFPSLHTAVPLFLAIHFYTHRQSRRFGWVAWPLIFMVANIVIATLYLRWHYAVDVVAGVLLAVLAAGVGRWARNQDERRVSEGRQATFGEPLGVDRVTRNTRATP